MTTTYLEPAMIPAQLRGDYTGKKFKAISCETMTVPASAGLWSGGSRDYYKAIELATGKAIPLEGQSLAPWDNRSANTITLKPGYAIIEHTIFCGKDLGLTFYMHPENIAALLPAPIELTEIEKLVLTTTRNYKSSYNGRDRYDMAKDDASYKQNKIAPVFPTRAEWEGVKETLAEKGFLTKAGAITPKGRNAIS